MLGALYLEEGIEKCRKFLENGLLTKTETIIREEKYIDFKSHFQEVAQAKLGTTPTYKVLKEWGPDHERNFEVGVYVNNKEWGRGKGASKQKGEVSAAEDGLKNLQV